MTREEWTTWVYRFDLLIGTGEGEPLMRRLEAYAQRSTHSLGWLAEAAHNDLRAGKTVELINRWLADVV